MQGDVCMSGIIHFTERDSEDFGALMICLSKQNVFTIAFLSVNSLNVNSWKQPYENEDKIYSNCNAEFLE